jgi:hypothetical protein
MFRAPSLLSHATKVNSCGDGSKFMAKIAFEDRHYEAALAQGARERDLLPVPQTVRYETASGRLIVEFENGAVFMIPAAQLQGLADASAEDLMQVELAGETGLHWPTLDLDLTVSGLLLGVFGTASFMEAGRKGGQSRSNAKAEAARRNGQRGGRPRKSS